MEHQQPVEMNKTKEQQFVQFVIAKCNQDKGFAARLRRADNPATEYQSWEILGPWVDLDNRFQRLPYATVAAGIARSKAENNGNLGIGKAIAFAYADRQNDAQAKAKLRRLLACEDISEVCRIIRPILTLVNSRVNRDLDYARLLAELRYFGERSKTRWAQDFYSTRDSKGQGVK